MYVRATAAVFIGEKAPQPWANGFALADDAKRVHFFALQRHEFRLISLFQAENNISAMQVSPNGSLLLINEGMTVTIVILGEGTISIKRTALAFDSSWWRQQENFFNEREFLLQKAPFGATGAIVKVTLEGDDVSETEFIDMSTIPDQVYTTLPIMYSYIPETEGAPDILLYSSRVPNNDRRLMVVRNPRTASRSISFITSGRGVMGRWVLNEEKTQLYLIVQTNINLSDFLAGVNLPVELPFGHDAEQPVVVAGHLVV
jgi:hypothetical protein